jgi:cyclophilin family peptidyl-prolyl cis-trans isomerase
MIPEYNPKQRDRRMPQVVPMSRCLGVVAVCVATVFAGCKGEARTPAAGPSTPTVAANPLLKGPAATPTRSPDQYRASFATSKGTFTVQVQRALAPLGADRFFDMVNAGYFTDVRFFRVVPGFVAQFGMHGDPDVNKAWQEQHLTDEPAKASNARGTIVFATTPEPNSRANQFFINLVDNADKLDTRGFAPIGKVVEGMDVVDKLNTEYGEQVNQMRLASKGNAYLRAWFPALDSIVSAKVVTP